MRYVFILATLAGAALASPLPFPRPNAAPTVGDYDLTWGGKECRLRLVNRRHYVLWDRHKGSVYSHAGDWEIDKGRLILWWGKLDAGGLPPGKEPGYGSAEILHLRYLPSDRAWAGKGWSDERQEWLKYEMTREK